MAEIKTMDDKIETESQDSSITCDTMDKMAKSEVGSSNSTVGDSSSIHDSDFSNEFAFFGDGPGVVSYDPSGSLKYLERNLGSATSDKNSEINSDFRKYFCHPEGSFMAFLQDKSEENVAELIKRTVSVSDNTQDDTSVTLYSLLPEASVNDDIIFEHLCYNRCEYVDTLLLSISISINNSLLAIISIFSKIREKIWIQLPPASLLNIRLSCKKFREEIDTEIGIPLHLCDSDEGSLRLALTTTVQRLVVDQLEMSTLGKLILCNPHKLKSIRIKSCVSREAIHDIFVRCGNIMHFEVDHKYLEHEKNEAVVDWVNGNLFRPEQEIKYFYGCFNKIRHFRFHTSNNGTPSEVKTQLLLTGLLPILHSINSPFLHLLDIKIHVTLEESKVLTDTLFDVFLKSRNLKAFTLKHYRSDSYTFEPIPNVDQDRKTSQYVLRFSENRPFPQFQDLHLEMPENIYGFFDWIYLMKNQRQLRRLTWDVGGNYWLYPVECIVKSARSLEYLMLRMIRCYQIVKEEILAPEPLSLGHFHEFIALKTFHIIGFELPTSQFCRMDLLPKNIENLQIECFQITPAQLKTIHKTLGSLKFLSINHWNNTRADFLMSLAIIGEMLTRSGRKYRALTFLEKSMYTESEQLAEMNKILDNIKAVALANNFVVDEISGDNGIGFILVINSATSPSSEPSTF